MTADPKRVASRYAVAKETAEEAYARNAKEWDRLMKSVHGRIKNHARAFKWNRTNWGYVGDLRHSVDLLKQIDEFLR